MTKGYTIKACLSEKEPSLSPVTVQGWVRTRRDSKAGISFITLHDGSCFSPMQLVVPNTLSNYEDILKLTAGCSIKATGTLVKTTAREQSIEMQVQSLDIIGLIAEPQYYPMQPKRHTLEFLREHPHLRIRTNTIGAVMRIRHCLAQAIHRFFSEQGYYWIHTPIITSSDCEGAGDMFRVTTLDLKNIPKTPDGQVDYQKDFFERETFLTVSGQLNAEAYCLGLSKVYTFGPTFRAENSNTSRHLAEFWMIEPEVAFATLEDIAKLSQELLQSICQTVLKEQADDMAFFESLTPGTIAKLEHLISSPFEYVTYTKAIEILLTCGQSFEYPVQWGIDLQSEHERYLAEVYFKKPVIVTDYPKDIKSFYMRLNNDGKTVAAMDVLAPGIGEIIGGSQREERLDILDARMHALGLDTKNYQWYRDLRRYGTVPHAGFGLGFERLISYVTGLNNLRDLIMAPRTPGHAAF